MNPHTILNNKLKLTFFLFLSSNILQLKQYMGSWDPIVEPTFGAGIFLHIANIFNF
jgi:hypothetical protein